MRKAILIIVSLVILVSIGLYFLGQHMRHIYGTSYDPNDRRDLQKLIVIGDASRPLRDALERFRHEHGSYPTVASNLFPAYLQRTNAPDDFSDWSGWNMMDVASNHYLLVYKVGWDDGLCYEHMTNDMPSWFYFSSVAHTDLTQKFEQR